MAAGVLDPASRSVALDALATEEHDVLVVGGGVVGAGCALDAAGRGLSVGLVEARDWASGTSSRSSKLIHGGLRYLEMLDFGLVREALTERGLLLERLAPHLVRPVPFLYPLTHRGWERPYVGAGLLLYDTMGLGMGWGRGLPRHRHLGRRRALEAFPSLRPDALVGALQYWDGQVDDARHTLAVVRTAAALGARCANRAQVVELLRSGDRITGAVVADLETGRRIEARARQVVNATGVWTDRTQALAGGRPEVHVRASKGVHLVLPRSAIEGDVGLILRTEQSVLFVIPWGRKWLVGTTDTDWDLDLDHPAASRRDVDYLLEHLNRVLRRPVGAEQVEGVFAGLRPLVAAAGGSTAALSREHSVSSPARGLTVVTGGKYTTYRIMARDAIDAAVTGWPGVAPSCTDQLPLVGADGWPAARNGRARLAAEAGLDLAAIDHLLGRYGSLVKDVLAIAAERPELAARLPGTEDYLAAEVVYAARAEGALHLRDVLVRRTRMHFESADRGATAAQVVADLLAAELGWDTEQLERERDDYLARLDAERRAQELGDDHAANAARLDAPDLVPTITIRTEEHT